MNMNAISFAVVLVSVIGELLFMKLVRQKTIPWKDVIFNLNSGHILMWFFRGVELMGFSVLLSHLNLHWVDQWPPVWQWLFAFIAWDFCFYWMHRTHHKLRILWAVHVVHHQGEHFNLSLGSRNSWYSSLSNFPFIAILAILGVPLEIFVLVSSFHYSVQFYNHNGIIGKSGFLEKFMVTPSHHRVHHGTDPLYINKNFGGTLLIWDKLFNSFQAERDDIEMRYGVSGGRNTSSNNPFWASNAPFFRYLKWPLPDMSVRNQFLVPDVVIGIGGLILFGLVIYYLSLAGSVTTSQQFLLFAGIFLGTIAIGGMTDQRRWGGMCWIILALCMPLLFVGYYTHREPVPVVLFSMLLLHGLDCLRRLLSKQSFTSENPVRNKFKS